MKNYLYVIRSSLFLLKKSIITPKKIELFRMNYF